VGQKLAKEDMEKMKISAQMRVGDASDSGVDCRATARVSNGMLDRSGGGTHASTVARGNGDDVGADQEALPHGASAKGAVPCGADEKMRKIPLVISDPFSRSANL
jgi:hypothetical protein